MTKPIRLKLSAFSMMWSMDVDVEVLSSKRLKLKLSESSTDNRVETLVWKFSTPPFDVISQTGKALLENPEWRISGLSRVTATPGSDVDGDFLSLCWSESDFDSVAKFLSLLEPKHREAVHGAFHGFDNGELARVSNTILESLPWLEAWNDLIQRFGLPGAKAGWIALERKLNEESQRLRAARQEAEKKKAERQPVQSEVMSDLDRLVRRYGRKIPGHLLSHITRYPAPSSGGLSDVLLLAWGRRKRRIPGSAHMPGLTHGDADLGFAHWILKADKKTKVQRIKSLDDADARSVLIKLRKMADAGRIELSLPPSNQAQVVFGRGLARMKVSLDPDNS